jgi:hypothetical protein
MSFRILVLTVLSVSAVATAGPDGGPGRATPDAGTAKIKGPSERSTPPPARPELPPPRVQTSTPVGTGSETVPPTRPTPKPDVPNPTPAPTPTPH